MSGYQRINFKDQNVERPKTYDVTNNPDGSITLIESFGNVEELGTPINQENMNHLEDGIDAVSFSKFSLDLTYKKDDLVTDIQDDELKIFKSLKDNNFGHLPSESDYWEEVEIAGGGGFEIGDIGIASLGIDESKGKRRYLNGQIIVQDQYAVFSEKVKNAIALYPTLGCTEQEWQTIATMSVGGQVGKFVVDNEGGTIRLPKIIMPIQGLTDLSKLAEMVEAGLPDHYHYEFNTGSGSGDGQASVTASQYPHRAGQGGYSSYIIGGNSTVATVGKSSGAQGSGIYGNSSTVQQEQIQYPYFIQVATGSETEDNIINEIELNNPFVLLESKYFESEIYNISWLLANGSYNGSNAVHPSAYQALLVENNAEIAIGSTVTLPIGTEYTKRGLSVKLSTDSDITDYDFVVNTSDETFRLPTKVKQKFLNAINGNVPVVGNGDSLGFSTTNATNTGGTAVKGIGKASSDNILLQVAGTSANGWAVTTNQEYSGLVAKVSQSEVSNLYLYFYVGETVQNANLVNVGRIEEIKANRSELDGQWVKKDISLGSSVSIANEETITYDLSTQLPNDNNCYEIFLTCHATTGSTSGNFISIRIGSSIITRNYNFICGATTRSSSSVITSGSCILPIGSDKEIIVYNQGNAGTINYLRVGAYRRIGANP